MTWRCATCSSLVFGLGHDCVGFTAISAAVDTCLVLMHRSWTQRRPPWLGTAYSRVVSYLTWVPSHMSSAQSWYSKPGSGTSQKQAYLSALHSGVAPALCTSHTSTNIACLGRYMHATAPLVCHNKTIGTAGFYSFSAQWASDCDSFLLQTGDPADKRCGDRHLGRRRPSKRRAFSPERHPDSASWAISSVHRSADAGRKLDQVQRGQGPRWQGEDLQ